MSLVSTFMNSSFLAAALHRSSVRWRLEAGLLHDRPERAPPPSIVPGKEFPSRSRLRVHDSVHHPNQSRSNRSGRLRLCTSWCRVLSPSVGPLGSSDNDDGQSQHGQRSVYLHLPRTQQPSRERERESRRQATHPAN